VCQLDQNKHICIGLLAHVDAGKTTLSEALLHISGARRTLGRVDHGDAFLDNHSLERARGITIFSKQALLSTDNLDITLVDTPGHVDFSAEAERVMPVIDSAVLIISGTDGVQAHTLTLWRLLETYRKPVFLFVNKMDLPGTDRKKLLGQLQNQLSAGCLDFEESQEKLAENVAMCDESLLETYLETGTVTRGNIRELILQRKIFPCCFGSGLKLTGIEKFLDILDTYAPLPRHQEEFGARVYKISRDPQGNRLSWMKITGGCLRIREPLHYQDEKGNPLEEKVMQLAIFRRKIYGCPRSLSGPVVRGDGVYGNLCRSGAGRGTGGVATGYGTGYDLSNFVKRRRGSLNRVAEIAATGGRGSATSYSVG